MVGDRWYVCAYSQDILFPSGQPEVAQSLHGASGRAVASAGLAEPKMAGKLAQIHLEALGMFAQRQDEPPMREGAGRPQNR